MSLRDIEHLPAHRAAESHPAPAWSAPGGAYRYRNTVLEAIRLGCWVEQQMLMAPAGTYSSFRGFLREMNISAPVSTVWRAVAVYRLSQSFPEIVNCRHLGIAHFSVILSLPEPFQLQLIRQAEHRRWSRRRLAGEVAALKAREADSMHTQQRIAVDFHQFHARSAGRVLTPDSRLAE